MTVETCRMRPVVSVPHSAELSAGRHCSHLLGPHMRPEPSTNDAGWGHGGPIRSRSTASTAPGPRVAAASPALPPPQIAAASQSSPPLASFPTSPPPPALPVAPHPADSQPQLVPSPVPVPFVPARPSAPSGCAVDAAPCRPAASDSSQAAGCVSGVWDQAPAVMQGSTASLPQPRSNPGSHICIPPPVSGAPRPSSPGPGAPGQQQPPRAHATRSQPLRPGRNVDLHNPKICNHITHSMKQQSSIQHPHLLEVTSIKLLRGYLVITEEQTNGGCMHAFIEGLQAAAARRGAGPDAARAAAAFADARVCVTRNIFQQMAIVVEFLHAHGLWGLALTPRSFFLNWTAAKCLIIKLRLPMLSPVTFSAAVAAGTEMETKMREDDMRSVFMLSLYVLLGPDWNKRPEVTQEPERGFVGALPLWSVPSDEDIAAMPASHRHFVRLARAAITAAPGEGPAIADIKRADFFRKDLPRGADLMNEQLCKKPRNGKREEAASMVARLVADALKSLQWEAGAFGAPPPPLTPSHMRRSS
eukprot:jgi/Ulvmu1/11200/UM072_0036.1